MLASYDPYVYSHWPVLNGMGAPTLDCTGNVGRFVFYIETKAPGEVPTPRQWITINRMRRSGATVFVLDGDAIVMAEFAEWIRERAELAMEEETMYE